LDGWEKGLFRQLNAALHLLAFPFLPAPIHLEC
jgi:hypothetical protein